MARMIDGLLDRVGPITSLAFAVVALFAQGSLSPDLAAGLSIAATLVLVLAVFSSVHHAEVIAHRVGEPFGTLVLTVAVAQQRFVAASAARSAPGLPSAGHR